MKNMRKIVSVMLCVMLCAALTAGLAACSKGETKAKIPEIKTMGDVYELEATHAFNDWSDSQYIEVFTYEDIPVRVTAEFSKDLADAVNALDFFDQDYNNKFAEIIKDCEITEIEDLSAGILDQKTLDGYVGKVGQDILDEGFEYGGYGFDGEITYSMTKGLFQYAFLMDGVTEVGADFDGEEEFAGLKVKSVTYAGPSYYSTDLSVKP